MSGEALLSELAVLGVNIEGVTKWKILTLGSEK